MHNSTAHIVAMTGSYFRGDSVPVLMPEDEAKFTKVTYTYYQQLNGYEFLKSLFIDLENMHPWNRSVKLNILVSFFNSLIWSC